MLNIVPGRKDRVHEIIKSGGYADDNPSFLSRLHEGAGFGHSKNLHSYRSPNYNGESFGQYTGRTYSPAERHVRQRTAIAVVAGLGYTAYQTIEGSGLI
jgi:hypothetical protein